MPKSTLLKFLLACLLFSAAPVSARYAAIVMDADTGRVVHELESTQRWYPASLTKVMTIYMVFVALESERLRLDEVLTVSHHAAMQPSSKLGLLTGQHITVEQAITAVTTRSANDAAVLLAERVGGSESHFAMMMTEQAHRLGMYNSSFQNASGLPDEGQISSARDLALLSATLIRSFPQYYHFFSATQFVYRGRVLPNTNRILRSYPDADGMKTGFTCGSGYNLIASAKRNGHRVVGVLLGGHSSAERFEKMEDLLDLGFERVNAGAEGVAVSQMHDTNGEPPPYQLVSNRCAGSAMQMGADVAAVAAVHHVASRSARSKQGRQHVVLHKARKKSVVLAAAKHSAKTARLVKPQQSAHKTNSVHQAIKPSHQPAKTGAKPVKNTCGNNCKTVDKKAKP